MGPLFVLDSAKSRHKVTLATATARDVQTGRVMVGPPKRAKTQRPAGGGSNHGSGAAQKVATRPKRSRKRSGKESHGSGAAQKVATRPKGSGAGNKVMVAELNKGGRYETRSQTCAILRLSGPILLPI